MTKKQSPFYRVGNPSERVPEEVAYEAYLMVTIPFLIEVASTYQGYVTYKQYAEYLFRMTGITTDWKYHSWPGWVLGMALDVCKRVGWPALTATVVNQDTGLCGSGFGKWHAEAGVPTDGEVDQEELAARLRVQCYRRYAPDVPEDVEKFHTPIYYEDQARQRRRAEREARKQPV